MPPAPKVLASPSLRIAIMGAGGVGGYYGARLAAAGHRVTFIARGAHAAAMHTAGLHIKSDLGDLVVRPVDVIGADDTPTVGPVDLVIVSVKLWDTEQAARAIVPLVGPSTVVVSLQNGVDKDEALAAIVGREHVLGGVTYILATIARPGHILQSGKLQRVLIGELAGGLSPRSERITAAMAAAGIDVAASPDIRRATWEKFVFLASNSAVTAVTRRPIGELRTLPAIRELLTAAMQEIVALARAEKVEIADEFVAEQLAFIDTLPADGRASMARDLLAGHRLELEWLSGAVVRRAAKLGLAAPVHRTLHAALLPYAAGAPPA